MKVFWNIILTLGLTTSVGFLAWNRQPTEMGIAFLVWAFLFLFWNLDQFEYLKIGQVEAKARKLDEIVKDAEVTLNHLKEVASPNMNYIFLFLADGMRYGQVEAVEQEEIFRELYRLAKELNLKNEEYIKRAFYGVINKYRMEIQDGFEVTSALNYEINDKENLDAYFTRVVSMVSFGKEQEELYFIKKFKQMKKFRDDFSFLV